MQRSAKTMTTTEAVEPLVDAVRTAIDLVDRWEREDGQWLAESNAADGLNALCSIAYAGFPKDPVLVDLFIAVADVAREWQQFFNGMSLNADGEPPQSFWDAFSKMAKQVEASTVRVVAPMESVQQLWKDLEGFPRRCEQIAKMYGQKKRSADGAERWSGPFFTGGMVDSHKVEKEAKEPGSILGEGYVPPAEQERRQNAATQAAEKLKMLSALKPKPKREIDIAALLYEGQYPDIVARVSGKSETEVRIFARENKIPINERGGEKPVEFDAEQPDESTPVPSADASYEEQGSLDDNGMRPISGNDLDQFLVSVFAENPAAGIGDVRAKLTHARYEISQGKLREAMRKIRG